MSKKQKAIKDQKMLDLLRRVMDGTPELAPLLYHINAMRRNEDACKYLISANLTGKNLWQYWHIACSNSFLKVIQRINTGLENEVRQIYAGKDLFK